MKFCKEDCGRLLSPIEEIDGICVNCWERIKKELTDFGEDALS